MVMQYFTTSHTQVKSLTWRDLILLLPFVEVSTCSSFPVTHCATYFHFSSNCVCSAANWLYSLANYTIHIHNIQKWKKPATKYTNKQIISY